MNLKLGDEVIRYPETIQDHLEEKGKQKTGMRGKVVYIHPFGRFHTVEFLIGGRRVRESFYNLELTPQGEKK